MMGAGNIWYEGVGCLFWKDAITVLGVEVREIFRPWSKTCAELRFVEGRMHQASCN